MEIITGDNVDTQLVERVIMQLKMVYDPEIPVDVYELGLIYKIEISVDYVNIIMTLTNPACPSGAAIVAQVRNSVEQIGVFKTVWVQLTFSPPYSQDMMSEACKLQLGFM